MPLVYENINYLSCMLNISANLGARKCLEYLFSLNWYTELRIIAPYDK